MTNPPSASARGLNRRTAAVLAYLALWLGAVVMLAVERDDPDVRFHAWQSILALGGLWVAGIACWVAAFLFLAVSGAGFQLLIWLGSLAWAVMIVAWGACLYAAATDASWRLPLAGPIADRWARR